MISKARRSSSARSRGDVWDQAENPSWAAATASRASAGEASAISASTSPVAGSCTSRRSAVATHSPPMSRREGAFVMAETDGHWMTMPPSIMISCPVM